MKKLILFCITIFISIYAQCQTKDIIPETAKIVSNKMIYSEKYGGVRIKTVNTKDETDNFDKILITIYPDPEGVLKYTRTGDFHQGITTFLGFKQGNPKKFLNYTPDVKFEKYLNELLSSDKNKTSFYPFIGTVPTKFVDIAKNSEYVHFKEIASRQFVTDGDTILINFYCTDSTCIASNGDKYYNKAMLFAFKENSAFGVDIVSIKNREKIVYLQKKGSTNPIELKNKEIFSYLWREALMKTDCDYDDFADDVVCIYYPKYQGVWPYNVED